MKRRKTVGTRSKGSRKGNRTSASAKERPRYLPEELAGMYRPVKKPVTVRLDADLLAWFQQGGRGYQTRINQALRRVMLQETKAKRN